MTDNTIKTIRKRLKNFTARDIILLNEIDSTMNYTRNKADTLGDRAVVFACSQTMGRGRFTDRTFYSPLGGLYMTLLFHGMPSSLLTPAAGVSVAQALRDYGILAEIKWVNDVIYRGRKLCGVLAQSYFVCGKQYSAVGIGVNVAVQDFPPPINETAAAANEFSSEPIDIAQLAAAILNYMDYYITADGKGNIIDKYREYSCLLGRSISFAKRGNIADANENNLIRGIAVSIEEDGSLVVKTEDGRIHRLSAGEVSVRIPK